MSEPRSRALLASLVGFATVSRDSNLALIEFVRDYLQGLGVDCELIYNAERSKANLFATIGSRHCVVRAHRRGAGGRPGLDGRAVLPE